MIAEDELETALRALHEAFELERPEPVRGRGGRLTPSTRDCGPDSSAASERFAVVGSTNDVVRDWLADGTPEVCLAVADEQSAGRGREGRTWSAPAGARAAAVARVPPDLAAPGSASGGSPRSPRSRWPRRARRSPGLPSGTIALKWPNDLVVEGPGGLRKLAGVLGESDGIGTDDPRAVIGIGVNGAWPRGDFPPDLADAMTSLAELASGPDRPRRVARVLPRPAGAARRRPSPRAVRRSGLERAPGHHGSRRRPGGRGRREVDRDRHRR